MNRRDFLRSSVGAAVGVALPVTSVASKVGHWEGSTFIDYASPPIAGDFIDITDCGTITFVNIRFNGADLEFVNARELTKEEIARYFVMPKEI